MFLREVPEDRPEQRRRSGEAKFDQLQIPDSSERNANFNDRATEEISKASSTNLFASHDHAMGQALQDAEVIKPGIVAYRKLSGALGESIYQWEHGGRVGLVRDLNSVVGNHLELLDASSPQELTSIKAYVTGRQDPRSNYASALRELIGEKEPQKLNALSYRLWNMKLERTPQWQRAETGLPASITSAKSPAELHTAIVDSSAMRIPDDHVMPVREYIYRCAVTSPESYGISPNQETSNIEAKARLLTFKVRSLAEGMTSTDIRKMAAELYKRKFARNGIEGTTLIWYSS